MKTFEHNVETGEITERDLTKAELDQMKVDAAAIAAQKAAYEAKVQAKAELLERLGITEDEAKLLLG